MMFDDHCARWDLTPDGEPITTHSSAPWAKARSSRDGDRPRTSGAAVAEIAAVELSSS
jgi:streptomycin 6-kinase